MSNAASSGHEDLVKLLIETDGVDVDPQGEDGNTPLSLAASRGHEGVVKLLLNSGRVDIDSQNHYGWTPLSLAKRYRREGVLKLLREKKKEMGVHDASTALAAEFAQTNVTDAK